VPVLIHAIMQRLRKRSKFAVDGHRARFPPNTLARRYGVILQSPNMTDRGRSVL
jgi:hypothetical protein